MTRTGTWFLAAIFLAGAFAGCLSGEDATDERQQEEAKKIAANGKFTNTVYEGVYDFTGSYSYTLAKGPYGFSPETPLELGLNIIVPSDFVMEGGNVAPAVPGSGAHLGLWLPDVPEGTKVPVIVDAGPYFGNGDAVANKPANRLGKFLIENFVPHGYAVAQLAVRGTGDSAGCMDLMGAAEQHDIDLALTWLGTQPWSNGAIGMTGRSYDGSTPWQGAARGNQYLKTIVPISGLSDFYGLMTHNGTSESRAAGLIHGLYFTYGFASAERSPQNIATAPVCPEAYRGYATAAASVATGSRTPEVNDYYYVRDFKTHAAEKWDGSIFMIHGLQDWNVEPHMGAPVADEFERRGHLVKQLWGQWGHMYPDRPGEHENANCGLANMRWDWAEIMLHWFDHELKGLTMVDTGPPVQIMDAFSCTWRNEEHFPPHDATWNVLHLGSGGQLASEPTSAGSMQLVPNPGGETGCDNFREFACQSVEFEVPLDDDTIISGLPRLHVTVNPQSTTGDLAAYLYIINETGEKRIAWTQMNIMYAAGGDEPQPVTPGQDLVMKMEFEPMDAVIPSGTKLMLRVWQYTYADHINTVPAPVTLKWGDGLSTLQLPIVERDASVFFTPPQPDPDADLNKDSGPRSE